MEIVYWIVQGPNYRDGNESRRLDPVGFPPDGCGCGAFSTRASGQIQPEYFWLWVSIYNIFWLVVEIKLMDSCSIWFLHLRDTGAEPFFPSAGLPNDNKTSQMGQPLQRRPKHMAVCREAQTRGVKCAGCPQMSAHPHEKAKRAGGGRDDDPPESGWNGIRDGNIFCAPSGLGVLVLPY
jgi:hypothetical protein